MQKVNPYFKTTHGYRDASIKEVTAMNHLLRTFVLTLAVGATALSSVSSAHADEWRRRYYDGPPPVERHHRHGEAAALGVIGLATGLIVGSAIASQPRQSGPVYNAYPADPYRRSPPPPPPATTSSSSTGGRKAPSCSSRVS